MLRFIALHLALTLVCLALPVASSAAPVHAAPTHGRGEGRPEYGWLIEPWVGGMYGSLGSDLTGSASGTANLSLIGPAIGAQVGPIYRYWFAALRANYLLPSNSTLSSNPKDL